jgi:hypothetical protein
MPEEWDGKRKLHYVNITGKIGKAKHYDMLQIVNHLDKATKV